MRPVLKGDCPKDINAENIRFSKYTRSRRYLIDTIGEYCSYCERKIEANLAVEHVKPKSTNRELELHWENFLLGCTNCNSTKGDTEVHLDDYLWPDLDNTFIAFQYDNSGIVKVNPNQPKVEQEKAQRLIKLCGLDKIQPKTDTVAWKEASDRRFEHRIQAWIEAQEALDSYRGAKNTVRPKFLPYILKIVTYQGFWSIWMKAFEDFREVQQALIDTFVGTRKEFFD
jgi:uncharacterized protein (TIGR02646 family)